MQQSSIINIESAEESIYDYLTQEPFTLSEDNVLEIYQHANKYFLTSLQKKCLQFIKKNISWDNLKAITDFANDTANADLLVLSLEFVQEKISSKQLADKLEEVLPDTNDAFRNMALKWLPLLKFSLSDLRKVTLRCEPSPETMQELTELNKSLQTEVLKIAVQNLSPTVEKEIIKGFPSPHRKLVVSTLHRNFKSSDEAIAYVKEFDHQRFQLDLDLRNIPDLNDEILSELSKYLPDELYAIHINSPEVSFVPTAKYIQCTDCTSLGTLKAPEATKVICLGCTSLVTLNAPKATWVDCWGCSKLTNLTIQENCVISPRKSFTTMVKDFFHYIFSIFARFFGFR